MSKAIVSKHWYASRSLWFNLAIGLTMIASSLTGLGLIPDRYLAVGGVLGNILLRFLTAQPIAGTPAAIELQALPPVSQVETLG